VEHGDVPPSQMVALKGSPRRVVWPPICPACGMPAILSAVGAIAVGVILWSIFVQGGEGVAPGTRAYAAGCIFLLVATGILLTWREARVLRVPPLTDITRACDFSGNLDYPLGRRRLYAIRNPACADAFRAANKDRLSSR
jgi:hypothetical protein